ncbi:hypothetical protein EU537_02915 [Candidatus Thorarchaeota archaeon]|nr:MAG: hypothetical protein EU537_02915 [Candidatus Thorarchaeota archaeon]
MNEPRKKYLAQLLNTLANGINDNEYMLMEYLGPVVDGSRAALKVSLEKARRLHKLTEEDFDNYMQSTDPSYVDITICFITDDGEEVSLVFYSSEADVFDECIEPDVTITGSRAVLEDLLDADSKRDPAEALGKEIDIHGEDSQEIIQGLGFLCYPSLLRIARSGVDPTSLLSEDADKIVMAAASELVTKMVRKWIDLRLENDSETI